MARKYSILKTLALGALVVSSSMFANAQSRRMVLVEEFTNTYCGPCASQNPSFKAWVQQNMSRVIPVIDHSSFPGSQDGLYQHNKTMNDGRVAYYGVDGVPMVFLNGTRAVPSQGWYEGAPGDIAALTTKLETELAKGDGMSPITMKVSQKAEGSTLNVDVDISTIEAVNNAKLRVVVVQEYIGAEAAGGNGETEFEWVARNMMPTHTGTALTLAKDESKKVSLSVPIHGDWKSNYYVVAFVQNDASKEVLQAASNFISPTTEMNAPRAAALKAPTESEEFTIGVKNNSEAAITYTWTLEKSSRTPADWQAGDGTMSGEIEVAAGASQNVSVRLTPGATAGIGDAVLTVVPKDNPDKRSYTHKVTVLSSNVEKLNVDAESAADVGNVGSILAETGHTNFIDVTAEDLDNLGSDLVAMGSLKYLVWNGGKKGGISKAAGTAMASLLNKGVGVMITGQVGIPFYTQADASAYLLTLLGIQYQGDIQAFTSGTFTMTGVSDDPITNGMTLTSKIAGIVPYYMQEIVATGDAVAILSTKSPNREVAARVELENARAVVFSLHPDVIQDAGQRKALLDKAMDWIEGFSAAPKPTAILNFEPEQPIDFGKVMVGKEKEITLEIRAANSAGLEISDISEFSDGMFNKYGISILGLPSSFPDEVITLTEGQKFSFKLRFAPTAVGEIGGDGEEARLSLWTNADGGVYTIDLVGEATENTTSVGETTSRNGEFSVSAGPNPFAGSSVVSYSLNSGVAKNVRIALFNEQGREVAVLVNSVVMPGAHTATIDGTSLSAGMYRVVMTVDGESVSLPVVSVK